MKTKYLPSQDRKNLRNLKKATSSQEIIDILSSIFDYPYTLQVLWEYRKWFNMLSKEELDKHVDLKTAFIQIKVLEGNTHDAYKLIDELDDNSYYRNYASLITPSSESSFIEQTKRLKEQSYGPVKNATITAGRPSVLSGNWDFSKYSDEIIKNSHYLDESFKTVFDDKGELISEMLHAEILYQRDQCYEALIKIVALLPFLKDKNDMRLLFSALTHEMFIMVLNNQVSSAKPIMESLRSQIKGVGLEEYTPNLDALEAWTAMYEGDYKVVTEWMQEDAPDEYGRFCMLDFFRYMVKIRAYLIQRKHLAITYLANKLQLILAETDRYMDLCELHLLWGISDYARGDKKAALDHMGIVLDLAEKYRFDRLIADEGLRAYEMLCIYAKERGTTPYLNRLIELSKKIALSHPHYLKELLPESPTLTPAELNVLRLLDAGHSNMEIAKITETSVNNAKFHCKKIYSKLEVSSRQQAIKKAREIGILN